MNFLIQIHYMDEKHINIEVPSERLGAFYDALSARAPYWIIEGEEGFWTDLGKVRHILLSLQKGQVQNIGAPTIEVLKKEDEDEESVE